MKKLFVRNQRLLCAYMKSAFSFVLLLLCSMAWAQNINSPSVFKPASLDTELRADQWCSTPGTLDDTCINNAIAALPANGGTVILSTGTYVLANTVTVTAPKRVFIRGQNSSMGLQHPQGSGTHGSTYITWNGTTGGTMFKFTATLSAVIDFSGLSDVDIDCGGGGVGQVAGVGVLAATIWNSTFRNLHISYCSIAGFELTTINGTGGGIDGPGSYLNANKNDNLDTLYFENSGGSGIGLWITGDTTDAGGPNTNYSTFHNITAFYSNAPGIKISTGDDNTFYQITMFYQTPGSATAGILLQASQPHAANCCNIFYGVDPSNKGFVTQTGVYGTQIFGWLNGNGGPDPTGPGITTVFSSADGRIIGPSGTLFWPTAPTIQSGFTSGASVIANNGTAAFRITVGTGYNSGGYVTMPAAAHGWICSCQDYNITSSTFVCRAVPDTTTAIQLNNYNISGALTAWNPNDVLDVACTGY